MPSPLPLTSERLERHGLFLIEDGQTLFLWVGRDAVPQLIIDVFDLPNYETLRGGKVSFLAVQYWRIIRLTRFDSRPRFLSSTIPLRLWALSALIQDRADVLPSYQQFIGQLKDKVRIPGDARHSVLD